MGNYLSGFWQESNGDAGKNKKGKMFDWTVYDFYHVKSEHNVNSCSSSSSHESVDSTITDECHVDNTYSINSQYSADPTDLTTPIDHVNLRSVSFEDDMIITKRKKRQSHYKSDKRHSRMINNNNSIKLNPVEVNKVIEFQKKYDVKLKNREITNICLCGGSVKGAAYGGMFEVLESEGILQNIHNFAGTSVGSIYALLLALGYNSSEIIVITKDFNSQKVVNFSIVNLLFNLVTKYGLEDGSLICAKLKEYIANSPAAKFLTKHFNDLESESGKTGKTDSMDQSKSNVNFDNYSDGPIDDPDQNDGNDNHSNQRGFVAENMTFEDLDLYWNHHDGKNKDSIFITTTSDLTEGVVVCLSKLTYPKMPLWLAVRMSISIPGVFNPIKMRMCEGECLISDSCKNDNHVHTFVDGGVFYNYPLAVFDEEEGSYGDTDTLPGLSKMQSLHTIGAMFLIDDENYVEPSRDSIDFIKCGTTHGFVGYWGELINGVMEHNLNASYNIGTFPRTVFIKVKNVGSLSGLSDEEIEQYIQSGRESTAKFLEYYSEKKYEC